MLTADLDIHASRDWRNKAACRQHENPDMWFNGDPEAANICLTECEVRSHCLAWANDTDQDFGIWGGEEGPFGERLRCGHTAKERTTAGRGCRACNRVDSQRNRERTRKGTDRGSCAGCGRRLVTETGFHALPAADRPKFQVHVGKGLCGSCMARTRRAKEATSC